MSARELTPTGMMVGRVDGEPRDDGFAHVWHVADDVMQREVAAGADVSIAAGAAFMVGLSLGLHFAAAAPGRLLELIEYLHAESVCGYIDAEVQIAEDVGRLGAEPKAKLS